jgi:putative transposase
MFSEHDFQAWCQSLQLSAPARALIRRIRACDPSRPVRSAAGNVSGRYPSRKMGRTIQFESHRNELAAILEMEHDPEVVEFYDQPTPIRLDYRTATGKAVGALHTPDYFVLGRASAAPLTIPKQDTRKPEDVIRLWYHQSKR